MSFPRLRLTPRARPPLGSAGPTRRHLLKLSTQQRPRFCRAFGPPQLDPSTSITTRSAAKRRRASEQAAPGEEILTPFSTRVLIRNETPTQM